MLSEAEQHDWRAIVRPVEFGCRGFIATSTIRLLKELEIHGQALQTMKEPLQTAERCSWWRWIARKDPDWAPGLISLWWACLRRQWLVIKRMKHRWHKATHDGWYVPNIRWWLAIYHQASAFKRTRDVHHLVPCSKISRANTESQWNMKCRDSAKITSSSSWFVTLHVFSSSYSLCFMRMLDTSRSPQAHRALKAWI